MPLFQTVAAAKLGVLAVAYVSRSKHIPAQATLAHRTLSRRDKALIVAVGGRVAAAQVVSNDQSRLVRFVASLRLEESVLVARLRLTTSGWLLFRCSLRGHFPVVLAVAHNPATGRRTRSRLMKKPWWGVRYPLAFRTDLTATEYSELWGHTAISLALAGNPSIPRSKAEELARSHSEYVSALASINPMMPLERRTVVANDPAAPAWVLHRMLADPNLPPDIDERVRVWLALGGGTGDPNFDPVSCTGTPGDGTTSRDAAYRTAGGTDPTNSPLWYTRALTGIGVGNLPSRSIDRLSTDGDPRVRVIAARYRSKAHLRSLSVDPFPEVARQADATLAGGSIVRLRSRRQVVARSAPRWLVPLAIAGITLGMNGAFSNNSDSSSPILSLPPGFTIPLPDAANTSVVEPKTGTWQPNVLRPDATPSCSAGGNSVWVTLDGDTTRVAVATDNAFTAVRFVQIRTRAASLASDQLVSNGQVGRFSLNFGSSDLLVVVIGARPDKSFVLDGLNAHDVAFPDRDGDC
jgi:hypothetical protein